MKIAKVKLPDGKIAKFQVSDDATEQDVMNFVQDFKFDEATNESVAGSSPLSDVQPMQEVGERRELEQKPVSKYLQQAAGATQNLLQGASFGLADEARGALRGLGYGIGAGITGREPIMQASQRGYREGTDVARQEEQQFAQEMPKTALTANIAGGFANPLNKVGAGFVGRGATTAGKLARGVGVGAGMGAGYGAGSAVEDERLGGAIGGGIAGGAVSGMLGLAGAGLGAVGKKIKSPSIYDVLAKRLQQDNLTPEQLKAKLAQAGGQATIADVGGENVRGLAQALTTQKGKSKNIARAVFDTRQENQANRIYEAGKRLSGGKGQAIYETAEEISQRQNKLTRPIYEKLMQPENVVDENKFNSLIKDEFLADVFKDVQAEKLYGLKESPKNSLKVIDAVKKKIDDNISSAYRAGENNKARVLLEKKNQLVNLADEAFPEYKQIREVWGGEEANKKALEMGQKFLSGDIDLTSRDVAKMTIGEKEVFREGVLSKLRNMLGQSREGANKASQILTPNKLNALKTAFPDDVSFKEFVNTIRFEDTMAKTRQAILGGSQRLAEQAILSGDQLGFMANLATGNLRGAIGSGIRNTLKSVFGEVSNIPEQQRNELGKLLFSQNRREVNQALELLGKDLPQKLSRNRKIELLRRMFALSVSGQTGSELMERE